MTLSITTAEERGIDSGIDDSFPLRLLRDHQYAVIDMVATPTVPVDWPLTLLAPASLRREAQTGLLPALLPLSAFSLEQLGALAQELENIHRNGAPLPILTLLKSPVGPEVMRRHLVSQLLVDLPNRKQALLRSYDPRVFMQLQWMLTPAQRNHLHGPITEWTIYYHRRWNSFSCPSCEANVLLLYTLQQARQLAHIGLINQVLNKQAPNKLTAHSSAEDCAAVTKASMLIDALLDRAEQLGFLREDEQVLFATHGMRYGKDFFQHPLIADIICTFDRDEQTYCDATCALSDADWARITNSPI